MGLTSAQAKYQKKFPYASDISFEKTLKCAKTLVSSLKDGID